MLGFSKIARAGVVAVAMLGGGCASIIESQTGALADNLSNAIYNNPDVESVKAAVPTFLIMIDGLIETAPESTSLLAAGASLNDAYGGQFVTDPARKKFFSTKALGYSRRAACGFDDQLCDLQNIPFEDFQTIVAELDEDSVAYAYGLAGSWLNWVQTHSDDWAAVADLSRVEALLLRVVEIDPLMDNGLPHLYLGGLATLLPPALGGKPEEGKAHFEKGKEVSGGKNLMANVVYAERYARLVFNQELHDELLQEVLDAPNDTPGLMLYNAVAKQQAAALLESGKDYF